MDCDVTRSARDDLWAVCVYVFAETGAPNPTNHYIDYSAMIAVGWGRPGGYYEAAAVEDSRNSVR